jgi:hypothetical protein
MPNIVDIFNNKAFSALELTNAINVIPNAYNRIEQLGIFNTEPVPTTQVAVQFMNGVLNLLPTRERLAPPTYGLPEKRNIRSFVIPHIPHEDFVFAAEVQNILAVSGGNLNPNALENVQDLVNRKLARMQAKHAITWEHMRAGAIKGQLLDSDGSTIYNWFTEFGVTEKVINFVFSVGTTNIPGIIRSISRYLEDSLTGEVMTGVRVLCSPEFFDALIVHPTIVNAYQYFASQQNIMREDVRRGFTYMGVTFEEYRGVATQMNEDKTTTPRKFIPTSEARVVPEGTLDTFSAYWGPADFIESVNAMGQQLYVKLATDLEFQRWVKLHTQSNPLFVCKRPSLLVRLTMS